MAERKNGNAGMPRSALVTMGLAWCVAAAWTATPTAERSGPELTAQLAQPADPPEQFRRVCIKCHTSDRVVQGRRFRAQWEELIEQMIARGAVVPDEDYDTIIGYLVGEYGRVNVNTASAAELGEVLHLATDGADAIVTARKAAGRFADFDALVAAPGVPVEALKARRDALAF